MNEIWTKTKAECPGEMADFPEMMARPRPVQKPHPPILVGGAARGPRPRWMGSYCRGPDGDVDQLLPQLFVKASSNGR